MGLSRGRLRVPYIQRSTWWVSPDEKFRWAIVEDHVEAVGNENALVPVLDPYLILTVAYSSYMYCEHSVPFIRDWVWPRGLTRIMRGTVALV